MANQWFKFYGAEYLSDPKMDRLSPLERSCWLTVLCLASMSEDGVIEFLTIESLLNKSGIQYDPYHPDEWEQALSVLTKFKKMRMIDLTYEGDIIILNWEKRQEKALSGYERVKRYRENKKKQELDNELITSDNVTDNTRIEENRIEENRILVEAKASTKKISKKEKIQDSEIQDPFNSSLWVQSLLDSEAIHINLIGAYFKKYAKHNFPTKVVAEAELKKNLIPASFLVKNFEQKEITKTLRYCQDNFSDVHWNLATVKKQITYVTQQQG